MKSFFLLLAGTLFAAQICVAGSGLYTDTTSVPPKKQKLKNVGLAGKLFGSLLTGKLSKKLFYQYWSGAGDYTLSDNEMLFVVREMNRTAPQCYRDSGSVKMGEALRQSKLVNFYLSKQLSNAIGFCTVYFNGNTVTGLYDYYDFNPKRWGVRPFFHEVKTRFMHFAGKLKGAKPFTVWWGER